MVSAQVHGKLGAESFTREMPSHEYATIAAWSGAD
jgi:hypothetical protein